MFNNNIALLVQVNSTNVRQLGNLLQGAVQENKKDFVEILLESG